MLPGRRAGPAAGIYPRMASLRSLVPFLQVAFASPVVRPVLRPQGLLRSRLFRSCRLRFRRFFGFVFLRPPPLAPDRLFSRRIFLQSAEWAFQCRFGSGLLSAAGCGAGVTGTTGTGFTSGFGSGVLAAAFLRQRGRRPRRLSYPERKWRKRAPAFASTEKFNLVPIDAAEGLLNPRPKRDRRSAMLMRAGRLKLTVTRPAISRHFVFDGTCPIEDETVIFGVLSLANL